MNEQTFALSETEQNQVSDHLDFCARMLGMFHTNLTAQGLPENLVMILVLEFYKNHFTSKPAGA